MGSKVLNYYASIAAQVKKSAGRKYIEIDGGDEFRFPCSVYIFQLAMREAVASFLDGDCSAIIESAMRIN